MPEVGCLICMAQFVHGNARMNRSHPEVERGSRIAIAAWPRKPYSKLLACIFPVVSQGVGMLCNRVLISKRSVLLAHTKCEGTIKYRYAMIL